MQNDVDVSVALWSHTHVAILLDDNKTEDLRVGEGCEYDQDDDNGVARTTERVFFERVADCDESLDGHTQDKPTWHQVAHVLGKLVDLRILPTLSE